MSSNTEKGRGKKGSKFWMQTLVNFDNGKIIRESIQGVDNSIGEIEWLSPLKINDYEEFKTDKIPGVEKKHLLFWPSQGPWWDAIGVDANGCILLVEAKANIKETISSCSATSEKSRAKIKQAMKEAYDAITSSLNVVHEYVEDIWINRYYQLGNRLTFLVKLREQGYNVKLIILNIVDDSTHLATSHDEWVKHYDEVLEIMIGTKRCPDYVSIVYVDVG